MREGLGELADEMAGSHTIESDISMTRGPHNRGDYSVRKHFSV